MSNGRCATVVFEQAEWQRNSDTAACDPTFGRTHSGPTSSSSFAGDLVFVHFSSSGVKRPFL